MTDLKLWQTPVADDAVDREKGKINSRGEPKLSAQVLAPTPSSTCSAATGDSPSPSRLWPTPQAHDAQGPKTPEQIATMRAKGHGVKNLNEEVRSAPSASRRSSPMPVPCSLIGSPASPTSEPFSQSPEIAYFASAVSSRLSSLAAFLANPTATPASDSPARTSGTSGPNVGECFGSYVPGSRSSRTSPGCCPLSQDFFSTEFCRTWPNSGTLAAGKLYQRPTLERPTDGSASGSSALTNWPSARAEDGESAGMRVSRGVADTLTAKVREESWLTPRANEPEDDPGFVERNGDRGAHCSGSLGQQVKKESAWPTPIVSDALGHSQSKVDRIAGGEANVVTQLREVVQMECSGPPPTASGLPDPGKRSTSGSQVEQPEDWPTPASDSGNGGPHGLGGGSGNNAKLARLGFKEMGTGKLNPSWVETLMGLPTGWTQLPQKFVKPRATP